jgi:2-isopropylmalate synthase
VTLASGDAEASAMLTLRHTDGRTVEKQANGDGPVDASFKAIELATGHTVKLRKFEVRSVSEGEDAQGEALVYVEYNGRSYRGSSVSRTSSSRARAFLEVINRIEPAARMAPVRRAARGAAAEAAV